MKRQLTTIQFWKMKAVQAEQTALRQRSEYIKRLQTMSDVCEQAIALTRQTIERDARDLQQLATEAERRARDLLFEVSTEAGSKEPIENIDVTLGDSPETSWIYDRQGSDGPPDAIENGPPREDETAVETPRGD